ncbi:240_t:CDS:1, partial [Dentiscutata heterogama]
KALLRPSQDQRFMNFLQQTCNENNVQYEDVKRCLGGLYHQASKSFHGHGSVMLNVQSWSPNEVLSIGVIFEYYKIPWSYFNKE